MGNPAATQPPYNHAYSIAFSVDSNTMSGDEITPVQRRAALLKRIATLPDDELLQAIGEPVAPPPADIDPDNAPVYSHHEMEAALCVWEYLNDSTLGAHSGLKRSLIDLRNAIGAAELRHASIAIGQYCLKVHDLIPEEVREGNAYDWVIIPAIVDTIDFSNGPKPTLPPERAAPIVVAKLCTPSPVASPPAPPATPATPAAPEDESEPTVTSEFDVCCPHCGNDDDLDVLITVYARLSTDGTEPDGDHDWDDSSSIRCECGWLGHISDCRQSAIARVRALAAATPAPTTISPPTNQ